MKNFFLTILFCTIACSVASAQEDWQYKNNDLVNAKMNRTQNGEYKPGGYVNIYIPSNVDALVSKHRYISQQEDKMDGWRIQLMQATDRNIVYSTRGRFASIYPKTEVYLDYKQPYFKLRVGNFKSRMDAYRFLLSIREDFDRAFLVQEKISKSKVY